VTISAQRSARVLGVYVAPAMATRTRRAFPRLPLAFALGLVAAASVGAIIGATIPAPAPAYAFHVAHGTEWHVADYNLTRDDCAGLLAALPADAPTARCVPQF